MRKPFSINRIVTFVGKNVETTLAAIETGNGQSVLGRGSSFSYNHQPSRTVYNMYGIAAVDGNAVGGGKATEIIEKRLGFDDTYVSAITFVDNKYKTARGVKVGDSWAMVTTKYGSESQIDAEDESVDIINILI